MFMVGKTFLHLKIKNIFFFSLMIIMNFKKLIASNKREFFFEKESEGKKLVTNKKCHGEIQK